MNIQDYDASNIIWGINGWNTDAVSLSDSAHKMLSISYWELVLAGDNF